MTSFSAKITRLFKDAIQMDQRKSESLDAKSISHLHLSQIQKKFTTENF